MNSRNLHWSSRGGAEIATAKAILTLCLAMVFALSGRTWAQAGIDTGSITGTVKDPSGAMVAGANCTLVNTATGVTQRTATTSAGAYTFPIVQVGTYTLTIEARGFEADKIDGIVVHIGSNVTEDARMTVGATSASVTVTSSAPLLQAQDASLGTTFDSTQANELPLFGGSGGRSFMDLITTVPGVQYTGNNDSTGTFLVHGVQSGAVDVRVNGADDNGEVFGGITIPPIPDAIEEMKVETGNNDADTGHSYGTVVNVTTKQGTNQFKGSVWGYDENDMFNANDYFNKRSQILGKHPNRPGRFKEEEPGFIVSGPVVIPHIFDGHNNTFFTVDYQYTHYVATPSYTGTLPTAAMQSSGFTNLVDTLNLSTTQYLDGAGRTFQAGTIMDPATTRAVPCGSNDPVTNLPTNCGAKGVVGVISGDPSVNNSAKTAILRDPYFYDAGGQPAGCPSVGATNFVTTIAGGTVNPSCFNQLPAGRLDPSAVALLKLFPQTYNNANINSSSGLSNAGTHSYGNNFYELLPQVINTQQYDVRLDHTFSEKDSAYATFSHYNQINQEQPPYPGALEGGGSVSFWQTNPTYMVVLTENHVFNPHLINEFRASDEHNWNTRMDPNAIDNTFGTPAAYGIQGIPQTVNNGGLPDINIGSSISEFGSRTNITWQKVGAWQFSDSLTKIVGKHEWKFGAEYWWTYGNIAQLPWSRGHFTYGQYSNVPSSGDGGPSMTDFLLNPVDNVAPSGAAAANWMSTAASPLGGVNGYNGNNWNKSTYHAPYIAFYAVDNWKITPSLTVNLGIREDYFGPYYSNGGTGSEDNFWMGGDGNEASGSALYVAGSGCNVTMSQYFKGLMAYNNIPIICQPNNAANKMPMFNWAPRLGIEYRVKPNLVVRAGAGAAYGAFNSIGYGGTLGTNYPFRVAAQQGPQYSYRPQSISNASTGATTATMENTFGILSMTNANSAYQPLGSVVLYGKPYNFHIPYVVTLNFAVQWQLTPHDSVEARYVGNLGKQLESADPYHNAPRQALTPSTAAVNVPSVFTLQQDGCGTNPTAAVCYGATSPLMPDGSYTIPFPNMAANEGPIENTEQISSYNAGEVEYQHQFGGGFDMDANYTYAGCLSDAQGGQQNSGGPANGRAPWVVGFGGYRADYDRCENMAAQVFNLRGVYDLPFGRGGYLLPNANGLEDAIIGGWKLIPSWVSQSGTRINVSCEGTIGGIPNATAAQGQFTGAWFQTGNTAWACDAPLVKGANPYAPGANDQKRTKVTGWLNTAAFTAPANAVTTVGQQDFTPWGVRGDQVYGPGWYDVDMSARKQFRITEGQNVEVIANAINAFNHTHFQNPCGGANNCGNYTQPQNETLTGGFGTITADQSNNGSGRIWEFAAKYNF